MSLAHSLERIRDIILNPMSEARRGYQGRAVVSLDDLGELWRDWCELDNAARQRYYADERKRPARTMRSEDL